MIEVIWQSIDSWLEKNATKIFNTLGCPATAMQISDTENYLGVHFPTEFIDSLKIHNGESLEEGWIFSNWSLLSLDNIKRLWIMEGSKRAHINITLDEELWSCQWIPFAYDGSGGYLIIDCNLVENGRYGQILKTSHDSPTIKIADGFLAFMSRYQQALINNIFEFEDGCMEVKTGANNWWLPKNVGLIEV